MLNRISTIGANNVCKFILIGFRILDNLHKEVNGVVFGRFPFELLIETHTKPFRKRSLIGCNNETICIVRNRAFQHLSTFDKDFFLCICCKEEFLFNDLEAVLRRQSLDQEFRTGSRSPSLTPTGKIRIASRSFSYCFVKGESIYFFIIKTMINIEQHEHLNRLIVFVSSNPFTIH